MRLFLLPISTRRALVYCQRPNISGAESSSLIEKGRVRAANLWASWEKKESGWQRKVVDYGNQALKRIPYEEWGLKSIPALSTRRKNDEVSGRDQVEVAFPASLIPESRVRDILKKLSTERQGLHKSKMIWSIVGMPMVAPFALVPVIPNIPFFYLVFRAWSHYTALNGSKHLEFLVNRDLVTPKPSRILDELYAVGGRKPSPGSGSESGSAGVPTPAIEFPASEAEEMVMQEADHKRFADALEFPELSIELHRAVWQVEKALNEGKGEKVEEEAKKKEKEEKEKKEK